VLDRLSEIFGEDWVMSAPELWSVPSFGALGLATQSAPNLGRALRLAAKDPAIVSIRLRTAHERSRFECGPSLIASERASRQIVEVSFLGVRSLLTVYLTRPPTEARFLFAFEAPAYAEKVRRVLGGEVVFGAPVSAIEFPASWLSLAPPLPDPVMFHVASWRLSAETEALRNSESLAGRVGSLLQARVHGRPSREEVAAALGVSDRTLARRLREEGTSFRRLLDLDLRRRAEHLLELRKSTLEEAASELGYSDRASFARARRRWRR